jgi:peptidoglycan/xylan/chitin deacetylase (PgdA/CDA1 family)
VATEQRPRAIVLTFDNLGEAAESAPDGPRPDRGRHPSVTVALPRLLALLAELRQAATFCVEAINAERYPETLVEIHERGHELAHHSWRHERWADLAPAREEELLRRGHRAFESLGTPVRGFRPPGGELTPRTLDLLHGLGYEWCSPLGERGELDRGVAVVPFRWPLVDAFYAFPPFAGLRRRAGLQAEPLGGAELERRLWDEIQATPVPQPATLILHPFLAVDDEIWRAVERLLRRIVELREAGGALVTTAAAYAARLRSDDAG